MKKFSKIFKAYLPPIIWAIFIYVLSSQSIIAGFQETAHDFILKKTAHIFVYFVLYLLLKRAIDNTVDSKSASKQLFLPILLCLLYAVSDEFHQSLVPGRYATLRDVGYDMLGVGVAFLKKLNFI
ncbi:VanZ family protein [Patescibacteria group bacterium]|nr:VanZ family protein [Patescibacteria group bacterium]